MILLDTSVLVESLSGLQEPAAQLRRVIERGERIEIATLVLYEWLRGPRTAEELAAQEALLPRRRAIPFGADEAVIAAQLYQAVPRARGREIDLAIAACAIAQGASLWTKNRDDFRDVPGLDLFAP